MPIGARKRKNIDSPIIADTKDKNKNIIAGELSGTPSDITRGTRNAAVKPKNIPIDPDGIELLQKYLEIRDAAADSIFLFPGSRSDIPMRSNGLRESKDVVAAEIGHEFTLQACRHAYGRRLIRDGVPKAAVMLHLGRRRRERINVRHEEDTLASTKQIRH
jgi:integrase